jgi:GNAT superfamily N-acetyltransferase
MHRIPDRIAFQAMWPSTSGPEPPPSSGARRERRSDWTLAMMPMPTVNFVEAHGVTPDNVDQARAEIWELLRDRGRRQAAWAVSNGSLLHAALQERGLEPYTDAPLEHVQSALALVQPPRGRTNPDVEVREVRSSAEHEAFADLAVRIFHMSDEDGSAFRAAVLGRYDATQEGRPSPSRMYLAWLDGSPVGQGQALFTDHGANLSGSSVLPEARGRGVYRALVQARWDAAVAIGRPALTVQAGPMSAPRLSSIGFELVADMRLLRDRG